jgi:hypothetical protein
VIVVFQSFFFPFFSGRIEERFEVSVIKVFQSVFELSDFLGF